MSYLRYMCLFTYNGVQHILCCVYVSSLAFFMLPVSLDWLILSPPSVFFNVYLAFPARCRSNGVMNTTQHAQIIYSHNFHNWRLLLPLLLHVYVYN